MRQGKVAAKRAGLKKRAAYNLTWESLGESDFGCRLPTEQTQLLELSESKEKSREIDRIAAGQVCR